MSTYDLTPHIPSNWDAINIGWDAHERTYFARAYLADTDPDMPELPAVSAGTANDPILDLDVLIDDIERFAEVSMELREQLQADRIGY